LIVWGLLVRLCSAVEMTFVAWVEKGNDRSRSPLGMTNKKGKCNRRSFDSATRESASYFAQDDSFIGVEENGKDNDRSRSPSGMTNKKCSRKG
jgi:hypothetical protein